LSRANPVERRLRSARANRQAGRRSGPSRRARSTRPAPHFKP